MKMDKMKKIKIGGCVLIVVFVVGMGNFFLALERYITENYLIYTVWCVFVFFAGMIFSIITYTYEKKRVYEKEEEGTNRQYNGIIIPVIPILCIIIIVIYFVFFVWISSGYIHNKEAKMDKLDRENIEEIKKRFTKNQLAEIVYYELPEDEIWKWRDKFRENKEQLEGACSIMSYEELRKKLDKKMRGVYDD